MIIAVSAVLGIFIALFDTLFSDFLTNIKKWQGYIHIKFNMMFFVIATLFILNQ